MELTKNTHCSLITYPFPTNLIFHHFSTHLSFPTRTPSKSFHPISLFRRCSFTCTPSVRQKSPVNQESEKILLSDANLENFGGLGKWGVLFAVLGYNVIKCRKALAADGIVASTEVYFKSNWPKILQVLGVFKEQGLILAVLLGLSAFFSMAETSITTLWPWKVAILLLTEITPKSVAVHHATEVARVVVRPVAWLSLVLYPIGRIVTFLSMRMLKLLGLKARSEPYVTEDELKLMLRVAESSGAIEEEEQDMIENVLEIKETHVREVMTPLIDVLAIDSDATLLDFHQFWVTHPYSRVPVFEQRIDNIVGIAYAMDLLDYLRKGEVLESTSVGDIAHKPAYFVPDSMSVWNLLREFRIRKVHMAVVLNEYGGTVGEEIQKKTGYVVMRAEGVFDVDANTSIDQLSEDLDIVLPEAHQYETVSGFICESFGYIPKTGDSINIELEKAKREKSSDYSEEESELHDEKITRQAFKLEILAGNCRKVKAVRFTWINHISTTETKEITRMIPRIWKRKWREDEDSGQSDDDIYNEGTPNGGFPQDTVLVEDEVNENIYKQ